MHRRRDDEALAAVEWILEGAGDAARDADDRQARDCVLDWLGVAIAGSGEPLVAILSRTLAGTGTGACRLLTRDNRATPWDAALVNGAAGHALDADDTHVALRGHPTAPVLPALLALAELVRCGGAELLAALAAGIETECRLAALAGPGHYDAGFHATGTLGTFGAAAGCASLLGLDDRRCAHALALAAAHAAGLKAQFGTMAKPYHAGRAAADGLRSALLAAEGFEAAPAAVAAFVAACHGDALDFDAAARRLGDGPAIGDVVFKHHAACFLAHATIENAAAARSARILPEDVERLTVQAPGEVLRTCTIAAPTTGLEGKFSLPAAAALGLLGDDTADPATFTDGRMTDPEVVALRDRVTVVEAPGPAGPLTWSALELQLRDARRVRFATDTGRPDRDLDGRERRLAAKFTALVEPVLGSAATAALREAVRTLPDCDDAGCLIELTNLSGREPGTR
jgi:2-methylcitrate dehydratase PrpD